MKKVIKTKEQAIKYCRFQKDRYWRNFQQCKSILEKCLNDLSQKSEDQLTKKDLLYLVSCNCDYMRSLNLYKYYKDELSKLYCPSKVDDDYDGPYDSSGSLSGEKIDDEGHTL